MLEPLGITHLIPALQKALDKGGNLWALDDIWAAIATGQMQLWLSDDNAGLLITELACYPRAKVVRTLLAAGSLQAVMNLQYSVAKWALSLGYTRTEITGSSAWERLLGRDKFICIEHVGHAPTKAFLGEPK